MKGSRLLIATLTLSLAAFAQSKGGVSAGATTGGAAPSGAATAGAMPGTTGATGTGITTTGPASNNTAGAQPAAPGTAGATTAPGMQGTSANTTGVPSAASDNTAGTQPLAPGATGTSTTNVGNGTFISGGYLYTGSGPASVPLLVTPTAHLEIMTPGIGATNSTGPLPAGAGQQGRAIAIGPLVPSLPMGTENSAYSSEQSLPNGESLAEYAARFRTRNQNQSAHVYTNADVDRLNQQTGGLTGTAVNAGNNPGTAAPAGNSTLPVVSQPAGQMPASPAVAAPATPRQNPQPQANPVIPHPQAEMGTAPLQQPTEMAQATPPARPGSSAAEASTQSEKSESGKATLPRSASELPLMAVMGFLAAIAGMFLRR